LTGFNGRVDAIYFSTDKQDVPPNELKELNAFRREKLKLDNAPIESGTYDLVVVGGGVAGTATAISAARIGLKVALIQNRSVLGGNNSSEVRVGLSGLVMQKPYPNLGNLLDELGGVGFWNIREAEKDPSSERSKQIMAIVEKHPEKREHNAGIADNYADEKKLALVESERNISLFLNTHVFEVEMRGDTISAVVGKNIYDSKEYIFHGAQFVDCTGDATLGYLSGAKYSIGRESKAQTAEQRAPEHADSLVMGASVQWYATYGDSAATFPACDSWAVNFTQDTYHKILRGDWDWEAGMNDDQILDIEHIRDHALRCVFGNWDFLKNKSLEKTEFANAKLDWVAFIGGKRESRRLIGDVVLTEHDILNRVEYDDASFTTTWGIDLHYPVTPKLEGVDQYRSYADIKEIEPYAVPYRCLYSQNIPNLFMAGRNISVSHVALGTVRVMRTGAMMGEVVAMAASICKAHNATPREVYSKYLVELKALMEKGVGVQGFAADLHK
ncbi:MAG: FAD-dependent oxidoreductase, partial [Rikenellaceae bacterium]